MKPTKFCAGDVVWAQVTGVCSVYIMAIHKHFYLSSACFLIGVSSFVVLLFVDSWIHMAALMLAFISVDYFYLKYHLRDNNFDVGVRATFLGIVFAIGIMMINLGSYAMKTMGVYTCVLSMFHFTEFLAIAVTNPRTLSVRSFVLDNGWQYKVAAISCWIEFFIELYLFPGLKTLWYVSAVGFLMCLSGEFLRKLAMWTASTNFNHEVQSVHADDHVLVTHGVYKYMRHPSYVGWFMWSIGSQILLVNPVCLIGYTIVSWSFFHDRIFFEEITLLNFFGSEYHRYQEQTGTGLPFIKGYLLEDLTQDN